MTCDIPEFAVTIYYVLALPFSFISAYIILLVEHDPIASHDHICIKWTRFFGFLFLSCALCIPYVYPYYFVQTLMSLVLLGFVVLTTNVLSLHFRRKAVVVKQIAYLKLRRD